MISLVIAADHAGLQLKAELVSGLATSAQVVDLGPSTLDSVDYPDYALKVTDAINAGQAPLGILVCGTGIGMSIAANKVKGIRAAVCRTEYEARMAREHNDANVLCLGQRVTGSALAVEIARVFVATAFKGEKHATRVEKLRRIEERR